MITAITILEICAGVFLISFATQLFMFALFGKQSIEEDIDLDEQVGYMFKIMAFSSFIISSGVFSILLGITLQSY